MASLAKAQPKAKEPEPPTAEEGKEPPTETVSEEGDRVPKKARKKLIIMGAAALVVLLAAVTGVYVTLSGKHKESSEVELGPDGNPLDKPNFYTMPDFVVNLAPVGKQPAFLKMTILLELAHKEDVPKIEANLPRALDAFTTYLRELHPIDINGAAGTEHLREELMRLAEKTLAPVQINDVLFKNIIIQ